MLECKNCSGHKNCTLLAVCGAFECRAQSNLSFTKANVTAKKSVHRMTFFHIVLDFINTTELVIGFVVFKSSFEVVLHINVG